MIAVLDDAIVGIDLRSGQIDILEVARIELAEIQSPEDCLIENDRVFSDSEVLDPVGIGLAESDVELEAVAARAIHEGIVAAAAIEGVVAGIAPYEIVATINPLRRCPPFP